MLSVSDGNLSHYMMHYNANIMHSDFMLEKLFVRKFVGTDDC